MDDSLFQSIQAYAETNLTPELQEEITGSLVLCDAFDYAVIYEKMPDVLFDTTAESTDVTHQRFLSVIHDSMDALLNIHGVALIDSAELHAKNQILSALYRIQHLEDPVPMLRILESSFSSEEKFAKIIEALSILDETVVLTVVDAIPDELLTALCNFLSDREKQAEAAEQAEEYANVQLMSNLKDFFNCHGIANIANEMIQNNVEPGYPIAMYLPYFQEHLVTLDDDQTAKNILAFLLMASDTYADPLSAYHQYSDQFLHDHERIMRIETAIGALLNSLRNFQKANDDAKRLSVVQHSAH